MKLSKKALIINSVAIITGLLIYSSCGVSSNGSNNNNNSNTDTTQAMASDTKIIFLHHSTGQGVWDAGVSSWIDNYNSSNAKSYSITERAYPSGGTYPWENYPYDYWNIWVDHAGSSNYMDEETLETLTQTYNVIIWKHCFPVSDIEADSGSASVSSSTKSLQNYKLQYAALKTKMHEFPNTRFIVWTGAARKSSETNAANSARAKEFFDWVKNTWDESGDNIFIWDFFDLETEGGTTLNDAYASGDSHPNGAFNSTVAPYLGQRIVDVVEGRGDTGDIKGQ